ncbi:MAG: TetR family transcriptional regulator [Pseudonocardiaceae bacterium]|nr:TetR family transcriptional regulator [Pseudonocardiaceae bacterium]
MATDAVPGSNSADSLAGREQGERADAARNRAKILAAAEKLVAARGVDWSMYDVARAAGVGVGTIYRRFGGQAGLIQSLMDEREDALQQAMTTGPPPLGPGARPVERIRAFLHAYVDLLDTYGPLMATAEAAMSSARRFRTGPYAVHQRHLATLIAEIDPSADANFLADALLAPLAAGLFTFQRYDEASSIERIKSGMDALLAGIESMESH